MNSVVLAGCSALLGEDLRLEEDAMVIIAGETIAEAGPRASVSASDDAESVDCSDLLLLPGFIDAHVHIGFYEPFEVAFGGVTTARDLGWPPERIHPLVRASVDAGWSGPRILAAGPMLTVSGGYPIRTAWAPPGTGRVVHSAQHAAEVVHVTADEGACVIKIALNPAAGPTFDEPTLHALVSAAHGRNLKVTAHIYGMDELEKAIDAGVDELAHILMSPEAIPPATIRRMVDSAMVIVPTLAVWSRGRAVAVDNLRRFLDAGGRVVYGTDLGNEGPRPGIDLLEIEGMSEAGMDARAIVRAATLDSSAWLGLERAGALTAGYSADIIAVPRAGLSEPRALADVRMVWRQGRPVRGS
jgi:imidazolonepropionase-like amidohydrolase